MGKYYVGVQVIMLRYHEPEISMGIIYSMLGGKECMKNKNQDNELVWPWKFWWLLSYIIALKLLVIVWS